MKETVNVQKFRVIDQSDSAESLLQKASMADRRIQGLEGDILEYVFGNPIATTAMFGSLQGLRLVHKDQSNNTWYLCELKRHLSIMRPYDPSEYIKRLKGDYVLGEVIYEPETFLVKPNGNLGDLEDANYRDPNFGKVDIRKVIVLPS